MQPHNCRPWSRLKLYHCKLLAWCNAKMISHPLKMKNRLNRNRTSTIPKQQSNQYFPRSLQLLTPKNSNSTETINIAKQSSLLCCWVEEALLECKLKPLSEKCDLYFGIDLCKPGEFQLKVCMCVFSFKFQLRKILFVPICVMQLHLSCITISLSVAIGLLQTLNVDSNQQILSTSDLY